MDHVDLSESFAPWWRTVLATGEYAFDVVVGARQSGKSTFFKEISRKGSGVVYWSIFGAQRARDVQQAWRSFFEVLGQDVTTDDLQSPKFALDDFLRTNGATIVIVDNWDDAVRVHGGTVGDAYYEMLDELWGYCREQTGCQGPKLGLVLVTSLPATSDLDWFSRQSQRPAFRRLSGAVSRQMRAVRFPFLTRDTSIDLLRANGYDEASAAEIADQVGGWLWLLNKAIETGDASRTVDDVVAALAQVEIPRLLSAALLPALSERPEMEHFRDQPLGELTRALHDGRRPEEFGLPSDYKDETALAPVLRLALQRTFVVVDTENVRVPFSRWADVHPEQLQASVNDVIRPLISAWVNRVAQEVGAAAHEVWLCGKSQTKIDQIVDATLDDAQRIDVPRAMRGKGAADDQLMGMFVAHEGTKYPTATFVLLSGDQDLPLLLDSSGFDGKRLAVHAPWSLGSELRRRAEKFGDLRDSTLGVERPPEVSDAQVRAARAAQRK